MGFYEMGCATQVSGETRLPKTKDRIEKKTRQKEAVGKPGVGAMVAVLGVFGLGGYALSRTHR